MQPIELPPTRHLLEHADFVRGLSRSLLGPDPAAEDVAQDTLQAGLETGPRSRGSAKSWYGRVVRNRIASLLRRRSTRRRWAERQTPPGETPDVAEVLSREETRRRVVTAMLGLSQIYREVLILRFYEDLKPREIAARLGVPVETVRTRTRRALELLRRDLDAQFGGREALGLALLPLTRGAGLSWTLVSWLAAGTAVVVVGLWFVLAAMRSAESPIQVAAEKPALAAEAVGEPPALEGRGDVATSVAEEVPDAVAVAPDWLLEGRVNWMERGGHAPDVVIEAWQVLGRSAGEYLGQATTDANGRYQLQIGALARLGAGELGASHILLQTPGRRHENWPPGVRVPASSLRRDAARVRLRGDFGVWPPELGKGHVMGRLVDATGRPISVARVRLVRGTAPNYTLVKSGTISASGHFDVPAGRGSYLSGGKGIVKPEAVHLVVAAGNRGTYTRENITVDPKQDLHLGTIRLEAPKHELKFRITLADGAPASFATATAVAGSYADIRATVLDGTVSGGQGAGGIMLRADAEGRCTLRTSSDEPYCIWVRSSDGGAGAAEAPAPDLEIAAGDPPGVITLDKGLVRIRILDVDGAPVAGAPWTLQGFAPERAHRADELWMELEGTRPPRAIHEGRPMYTRSDYQIRSRWEERAGLAPSAELSALARPGSVWIVTATTEGRLSGRSRFEVPRISSEEPTILQLERLKPGVIRFIPHVAGEPVDAWLQFHWSVGMGRSTPSKTFRGTTDFGDLSAGEYDVRMLYSDHVMTKRSFKVTVRPGEVSEVRVPVTPGGLIRADLAAPSSEFTKYTRATLFVTYEDGRKLSQRAGLQYDDQGEPFAYIGSPHDKTRTYRVFPPGRARVHIASEGYECEPVDVDIRVGETARVSLVMRRK